MITTGVMAFCLAVVLGTFIPLAMPYPLNLMDIQRWLWLVGGVFVCFIVLLQGFKRTGWHRACRRSERVLGILAWMLAVLGVLYGVTVRIQDRLQHRFPEEFAGVPFVLEGWLDDLPRTLGKGTRFSLRVTKIQGGWLWANKPPERIWLTSYEENSFSKGEAEHWSPKAGECWHFQAKLKPPHGLMNPHTFDTEQWLFSHGFDATGVRMSHTAVWRMDSCANSLRDQADQGLQHLRAAIREKITHILGREAPYVGVIVALVIGDQAAIPDVQWRRFNATGIGHLISISGFHITFLAGVVIAMVRRGVRRFPQLLNMASDRVWSGLAGVAVSVFYVLLAGGGVPAQRTAWMMAVMSIAWALGKSVQGIILLAWAVIGILLMDSFASLSAGFWLSFVGVAALMLSGAGRVASAPAWKVAVKSQWIATWVLMPISWYGFGQISLVAPLANALAIPLISLCVTPLALLGSLFPYMEWSLKWAHECFVWVDRGLSWIASGEFIPAIWQGSQPSLWATIIATLGLAYACAPVGLPLRYVAAGLSILPLYVPPSDALSSGVLRMTVLDVGQGLSILLETAHHRLLYDAGPRPFGAAPASGADAGSRVILPFLKGEGISSLDMLVISHNDLDHRGGVEALFAAIPIHQMLNSDVEATRFSDKPAKTDFFTCVAGQSWEWDKVKFEVLSPSLNRLQTEEHSNNRSCVLKVSSEFQSVLLTGDAEFSVESELLATMKDKLRSTVLVAGHHGSHSSSSEEWLAAVNPTWTIFTSGYLNHYGHPHQDVVERVRRQGSLFARSDREGAMIFVLGSSEKNEIKPRLLRQGMKRAWR